MARLLASVPPRPLAAWLALLLLGTLHPFTWEVGPVAVPSPTFWLPRLKGLDPPLNVLIFVPLGWGLRSAGWRASAAVALGFAVSAGVEGLQHFIPFRVPVAEDLLFNTLGTGAGWALAPRLARAAARWDGPRLRAAVALPGAAFILWAAAPPVVTPRLWTWDPGATLRVGREVPPGPGREAEAPYRWPGEVRAARLWVGARPEGPPDWDWRRDGEGAFEGLAQRVEAAQAFLLQVVLRAPEAPPRADDPARVVVWSSGVQRRNLLLGQDGERLVFRVRTRVTPIVGLFPDRAEPLSLPAPPPGRTATVTITYAAGALTGEVGGVRAQGVLQALPPHNGARRLWLPRGPQGGWLFAFAAGLTVAAALAAPGRGRRAAAAALAVVVLQEGLQLLAFERGPDLWALVAGAAGAGLGAWALRGRRGP
jgi:hypothetical protein